MAPRLYVFVQYDIDMYYAFIDESESPHGVGNPEPSGYGIYYIGCLLVDEAQLSYINNAFVSILQRVNQQFGIALDAEFHGQCMFQYKEDWKPLKGKHRASVAIYKALMRAIAGSGAKLFVRGIHKRQLVLRYGMRSYNPHAFALQFCLERVNYYAETENIKQIEVVADKVGDPAAQEGRLLQYKTMSMAEGYISSPLDKINFPFHWEDSKAHFGLQAIDTALFILNRAARLNRENMVSKGDREVLKIAQILIPVLHRTSGISYLSEGKFQYLLPELASGIQ
ncbi:DUF3800 domain-containing protein [Bifidobacterium sp. ESL0775]|uniref:DUF3800 domain-containing protein n=1 Tax=Bifidobacterium sp. ESL0775 TaxID=2983230 RepID=UPI0023F92995|nr:DUF3800 domain-containing protein [Bifidobacterium sp. ESL0775]WEV69138.1 DUF3800 domain-containing protein [Bifidobacterium sp. ESL0775]